MRRSMIAAIVCGACSVIAQGHARASEPDGERHLGVQARFFGGPALLYAWQSVGAGASGNAHGVGMAFDVALGAMVSERLALNMDLVFARSGSAEHGVLKDTAFSAVHLGGGLTYWWMPANLYFAGSIGIGRSSIEGSPVHVDIEIPTNEQSKIGIGAHLALGKQWWISSNFGLGATLSLLASTASNPAAGHDTNRYLLVTTAALCATMF